MAIKTNKADLNFSLFNIMLAVLIFFRWKSPENGRCDKKVFIRYLCLKAVILNDET
jgi:hypothetical protein